MPSTYTTNLGIELPADGELDGVWGEVVNENMDILDRAINGVLNLTLSGTSSTLTTSDGALSNGQYKLLKLDGTLSATHTITISPNDAEKIYFVQNNTAQTVEFNQGSGANALVFAGDSAIVYSNGAGATGTVINLTDTLGMDSVNITGGSITGLSSLGLSSTGPFLLFAETDTTDMDARIRLASGDLIFSTVTDANVEVRENMRIVSGGNVGIGTSDPFAILEVSSSTNATAVFIAYISGTTMTVTGITSGTITVGSRVFGTGVEWNTVITSQLTGTTGASGTYSVSNSQTVSTAPGISLSSFPAGNSVLRLTNTDTTESPNQTTGGVEFYGSDETEGAGVKAYVAAIAESTSPDTALIFGTSDNSGTAVAVERMRINADGDVGIGTKSPAAKLNISVDSSGDALRITQIGTGNALVVEDSTNPDSTPFVVTADGSVGIGIGSPTVKLAIVGDGSQAVVYRTNNTRYAALGDTDATDDGGVLLYDTAGDLQSVIRAQSNSYVQGGNFGIGKNNPAVALDVVGAGTFTGNLTLTSTGPAMIFQETDTTNVDGRVRRQGGDFLFETITDAGTLVRENFSISSTSVLSVGGLATKQILNVDFLSTSTDYTRTSTTEAAWGATLTYTPVSASSRTMVFAYLYGDIQQTGTDNDANGLSTACYRNSAGTFVSFGAGDTNVGFLDLAAGRVSYNVTAFVDLGSTSRFGGDVVIRNWGNVDADGTAGFAATLTSNLLQILVVEYI